MVSFEEPVWTLLKSYLARNAFYFCLAVLVWCACGPFPASGELTVTWCATFILKKQFVLWVWYEGIERALGNAEVRRFVSARKFDNAPVRSGQVGHDCFWTNLSMVVSSSFQLCVISRWSSLGSSRAFWDEPVWSVCWLIVTPLLASLHFYLIHRLVHIRWPLDLYRQVHYLHHLSRNPSAWSGMSMHPVEAALYLSRAPLLPLLVPLLFGGHGLHELHLMFASVHAELTPAIDHSGFAEEVTGGSRFHFLHHKLVVKNYGSPLIPFDRIFGTFAA